jgi:diacylglycerol kinase (ATP)
MSIHVIANLSARGLKQGFARRTAIRELTSGRATLHETSRLDQLPELLEQIVHDGCELLILGGGDGTFMSGVSALVKAKEQAGHASEGGARNTSHFPVVGLLPLGTVGTVARNFGPAGKPEQLLEQWLSGGELAVVPRPTLRVEARLGVERVERVGFIVGTGLVAQFFDVYEARGATGTGLAAKIAARIFVESFRGGPLATRVLTPTPCELTIDGKLSETRAVSLLLGAVVRDLGLSMKVCYRAGEDPERFHLVASSLPPVRLGRRAPLVMLGREIGGEGSVDRLVRSFDLRFVEPGGRFVLDGDLFSADSFAVRAGPVLPIIGPRR